MSDESLPVTPRTGVALPSERYQISGIPEGFSPFPDADHIGRASDAISALASFIDALRRRGERELAIKFCHVVLPPGMPMNLFGFHVWTVDPNGALVEPLGGEGELILALIVNQPVELQIENAVAFLYTLAERQRRLAAVQVGEAEILDLPQHTADADRTAAGETVERFRYGWREAARGAVEALAAVGVSLTVRYEVDVFPRRELIDRRLPLLRRVYNEIEPVRVSIDRIVGTIGGRANTVRGSGPEEIRGWTQQQLALLDIRRYMNHALRDGEVCGNGYLIFDEFEPFAPYAARPEEVRAGAGGRLELRQRDIWRVPKKPILHVRGIEQIESPYGVSMLEPFMYSIERFDRLGEVNRAQREMLRRHDLTSSQRRDLEARITLVESILKTTTGDITSILRFFHEQIAEPERPLYLPGHETYR